MFLSTLGSVCPFHFSHSVAGPHVRFNVQAFVPDTWAAGMCHVLATRSLNPSLTFRDPLCYTSWWEAKPTSHVQALQITFPPSLSTKLWLFNPPNIPMG